MSVGCLHAGAAQVSTLVMRARLSLTIVCIAALPGCGDGSDAHDAGTTNTLDADNEIDAVADGIDRDSAGDVTTADAIGPTVEHELPSIGYDAREIANPERGQYLWLGKPAIPAEITHVDSYLRWNWRDFETSKGVYALDKIEVELGKAAASGGRFGLRIMPMCSGCEDTATKRVLPDYLHDTATFDCAGYRIPDWNSAVYLERLEALLHAIGDKYGKDPRFGFVDIMGYGNWGEWHVSPFTRSCGSDARLQITDANVRRIIDAHTKIFPERVHLVSLTHPPALAYIKTLARPIGLRVDCFGATAMMGGIPRLESEPEFTANAWKRAPFITEWCNGDTDGVTFISYPDPVTFYQRGRLQLEAWGISMLSSGNFPQRARAWDAWTAAEQTAFLDVNKHAGYRLAIRAVRAPSWATNGSSIPIDTDWENTNVAPPYRPWTVRIELRQSTRTLVATVSTLDVRKLLPTHGTPVVAHDVLTIPTTIAPGTYDVVLTITDPEHVAAPLALATTGRATDGSYALTKLEVL
jgi:hypothetical protein